MVLAEPSGSTAPARAALGGLAVRPTLLRVLKNGLLTAVLLFVIGIGLSELATTGESDDVARAVRQRLPAAMAAWGLALVTGFELLLWAWRRKRPAPAPVPTLAPPSPEDVDALLNQLLEKAEADRALHAAVDVTTPPPGCPVAEEADNSPTPARLSEPEA